MPINPIQFQRGLSLPEFFERYGSEEQCEAALEQARWPTGFVCPDCGERRHCLVHREGQRLWQCARCRKQTSLTAGTIFESTRLPLRLWFVGIYHLTQPKNRYRATTDSNHRQPVFENRLERDFSVDAPDHVYAGDITYVWTQEGWLYLAVVIDLYSRKVVGWSMGRRLTSSLVCDALRMALWQRRPPKEQLLHHSDRDVQYASRAFRTLLRTHGIEGSMSRKGDCWDNAVLESFFGSLKSERVHWRSYHTREEARADIVEYITMFYNSRRLHSYLGYQSPDEFERNGQMANAA